MPVRASKPLWHSLTFNAYLNIEFPTSCRPNSFCANDEVQQVPDMPSQTSGYPCAHCGRVFSRPYHLRAHLDSLAGRKPFACDICATRFVRQHDLRKHKAEQHGSHLKFCCENCGRVFDRKATLQRHQRGSCKAAWQNVDNGSFLVSLPLRASPKLGPASTVNNLEADEIEMRDVDETVISDQARTLMRANARSPVGHTSRLPWQPRFTQPCNYKSAPRGPRPSDLICSLNMYQPSFQQMLNIDLIAWNAIFGIWPSLYQAVQKPEPLRTELLCDGYSKIHEVAQQALEMQRCLSYFLCVFVLVSINVLFDGSDTDLTGITQFVEWTTSVELETNDAAKLQIDQLDIAVVLPSQEEIDSSLDGEHFSRLDEDYILASDELTITLMSEIVTAHCLYVTNRINEDTYEDIWEVLCDDEEGVFMTQFSPLSKTLHNRVFYEYQQH